MGIRKIRRIRTRKNTGFSRRRTVAVSKAYDWRDDPYELMLLQQRLKPAGSARQVEKRHLHLRNKKIDTSRLEYTPVTNDAINSITAKSQEDYYNKARSIKKDGQAPMKDRLSFKRLLKAEDLRKSSYRSDKP
jgi:cytochrome oxidase assembly protein ShyY1